MFVHLPPDAVQVSEDGAQSAHGPFAGAGIAVLDGDKFRITVSQNRDVVGGPLHDDRGHLTGSQIGDAAQCDALVLVTEAPSGGPRGVAVIEVHIDIPRTHPDAIEALSATRQ